MNKNKKSADSADKVQTHLSALFNKGIGPYNIDIIIYIYIYFSIFVILSRYPPSLFYKGGERGGV